MPHVHLPPATTADYDLTFRIKEQSLKPYIDRVWGWDDTEQHNHHHKHFQPENISFIHYRSEAVGYLEINEPDTDIYIGNILIAEAYQGRGIGTYLLRQTIARASEAGKTVSLSVLKVNTRARKLYEQLGLHVSGEDDLKFRMVRERQ